MVHPPPKLLKRRSAWLLAHFHDVTTLKDAERDYLVSKPLQDFSGPPSHVETWEAGETGDNGTTVGWYKDQRDDELQHDTVFKSIKICENLRIYHFDQSRFHKMMVIEWIVFVFCVLVILKLRGKHFSLSVTQVVCWEKKPGGFRTWTYLDYSKTLMAQLFAFVQNVVGLPVTSDVGRERVKIVCSRLPYGYHHVNKTLAAFDTYLGVLSLLSNLSYHI